jgi:hypothetical protein
MVIYVMGMVMNYNFGWCPLFVVFIYYVYLSYEKTCIKFHNVVMDECLHF